MTEYKKGVGAEIMQQTEYAGLVYSVAKRFFARGYDNDDIIQSGYLGLVKAQKTYDQSRGAFAAYAFKFIEGEIRAFLRKERLIAVSRDELRAAASIKKRMDELTLENGNMSVSEAAEKLGIDAKILTNELFILELASKPCSLDDMLLNNETELVSESFECESTESLYLRALMKSLDKNEARVLYLRYFTGATQRTVAETLNRTQSSISKIEKNAMEKLRTMIRENIVSE
ncbi:MAG: sigma-70 family RNA polymerase sigma factor [Clostridia bacterium]|nr:sigma-70 family RNA polymerase sigma factor [Clostridia bacterium]